MKNIRILLVLAAAAFLMACDNDDNTEPVTEVRLSEEPITLEAGEEITLTAEILPASAGNKSVTWHSSDSEIATVDDNGKVTGIVLGNAVITVITDDGNKTASCEVAVTQSYSGSLSVVQDDNSTYTQSNVITKLKKTGENEIQMEMLQVQFASGMHVTLDMTVDGITCTESDSEAEITGNGLIPKAMGGEFPVYTITELTGNISPGRFDFSMMCGKYPLSYSGTR